MFAKLCMVIFACKAFSYTLRTSIRKTSFLKMASTGSALLASQRDSYAMQCTSKVISCTKNNVENSLFHVILDDSVLYPEGGGQPWDLGKVNGIFVEKVLKGPTGNQVVVDLKEPVEVGSEVLCEVDWTRRYDFMQQHTAQV